MDSRFHGNDRKAETPIMNIILMGYRCSGKTSAGRHLAALLGRPFFDTDELIRHRTGKTIEAIVAERGWPAFRDAERGVIRNLALLDGGVIASGGGTFLDARNVESLKKGGFFVWLVADAATIARRLEKDQAGGNKRPSLSGEPAEMEVREILAQREPLYRRLADIAVDTTEIKADRVAEAICAGLRKGFPQMEGII
jgi:shikimate kinase